MDYLYFINILSGILIAALFIWGKLEWYAAIILGFIGPFVGLVISLPLTIPLAAIPPKNSPVSEVIPMVLSQLLILVGSFFVARNMRRQKS